MYNIKQGIIKKIERDFNIYKLYDLKVYEYRIEPLGWVVDRLGLIVDLVEVSHYHIWEDEVDVYYKGKNSKGEEVIFRGISYYPLEQEYERGEWVFANSGCID